MPSGLGGIASFLGGMAIGFERKRQADEAEKQKNARELLEKSVIGPGIEGGNVDLFDLHEPTLKKHYTKEQLDLFRSQAATQTSQQKLKRLTDTLNVLGVGPGGAPQMQAEPQPTAPMESPTGWSTAMTARMPGAQPQPAQAPLPTQTGKPVLQNPDGSVSTERTITVEADGKHYVIPTIVNGQQVSNDEAVQLWRAGSNQPVGQFGSAKEANTAAQQRSGAIGQSMQAQARPAAKASPVYKRTVNVNDQGKVSVSFAEVSPEDGKRDTALLQAKDLISSALSKGQPVRMADILQGVEQSNGVAFKSEEVDNLAKTFYGAAYFATLEELQKYNAAQPAGKKLTDAQMYGAAAHEASKITGMRGIPQSHQDLFKPDVPKLPPEVEGQLARQGRTPRTAQPGDINQAYDAAALEAKKKEYDQTASRLQAELQNKAIPPEAAARMEPLFAAERVTARILDIASRKPYLLGKGFTDFKTALQTSHGKFDAEAARGTYKQGAIWNSLAAFMGTADPEAVELYKSISDVSDLILRAKSGAQINEAEYSRLVSQLFTKWDEPNTFFAGLDRFRGEVTNTISSRLTLLTTPAAKILQDRVQPIPGTVPGAVGQPSVQGVVPSTVPPPPGSSVMPGYVAPTPGGTPTVPGAPSTVGAAPPFPTTPRGELINFSEARPKAIAALNAAFPKGGAIKREAAIKVFLDKRVVQHRQQAEALYDGLMEFYKGKK